MPSPEEPGRRRVLVGEFGRAHGVRGELRLRSFTADPLAILGYGPLQSEDGRALILVGARPGGPSPDRLVARVEGVSTRSAADALAGTKVYVPRERLPEVAHGNEFYHADLIGLRVEDQRGRTIGTVAALHDFGAGDLLEIVSADDGRTAMVAFTEELVPMVDVDGGRVVVSAPDLFAEEAEQR